MDRYTELQRIRRWFKVGFIPLFLPIFIIVISYIYLGYTLKQAISFLSPDCSLAILSLMLSVFSAVTDIEKRIPPKTKENYLHYSSIIGILCIACYFFATLGFSVIERNYIYIFLPAITISIVIGILFTRIIHKMQTEEFEQRDRLEQLLTDEQTEKQHISEELNKIKEILENEKREKDEIQKKLELVQKELEEKKAENIGLKAACREKK